MGTKVWFFMCLIYDWKVALCPVLTRGLYSQHTEQNSRFAAIDSVDRTPGLMYWLCPRRTVAEICEPDPL